MKKNKDLAWIIFGVLVLGGFLWLLLRIQDKHYNWEETYYISDEEPFCNSVLLDLAETYFPGKELTVMKHNMYHVFDTIESSAHTNYFFAGNTFFMEDSTLQVFLDFIYKGNDAFIAARSFSDEVAEELFRSVYYYLPDTSVNNFGNWFNKHTLGDYYDEDNYTLANNILLNLTSQNITLNFMEQNFATVNGYAYIYAERDIPSAYNWKYFTEDFIQKEGKNYNIKPIGKVTSGGYNFIMLEHGRGKIYFFSTPLLLTNLYLIEKENLEYTSKLLSYLEPGNIIWDEYSKHKHGENYTPPETEGPLQFILSQQSLRWAWYLLLTGLCIFILFRGKRMQQTIPVTEPNINKSLEFSQTIGRMHYLSRNNANLVQQKMKLLLHHIKERYRIQTQEINDTFYQKLSLHAQIPETDIKHIFNTYRFLTDKHDITDEDAIDFYDLIHNYYKNCK